MSGAPGPSGGPALRELSPASAGAETSACKLKLPKQNVLFPPLLLPRFNIGMQGVVCMDTNYDKKNKPPPKMRILLSGVSDYEANAHFNSCSFSEIVFKKLEVTFMS